MNIVEIIANTGGLLGLAIFAIWMLNKVWEDRLKKQEATNEDLRQMRDRTQACVEESTRVIAANTEVLRANTEVMAQLLVVLRERGADAVPRPYRGG